MKTIRSRILTGWAAVGLAAGVQAQNWVDFRIAPAASPGPPVQKSPLDAPAWAVPYGKEFWRQPAARVAVDPKRLGTTNVPAPLNVGEVIERVRHALGQSETTGEPQVAAQTYSAAFDGQGLVFSPHRPGDGSAAGSADILSALGADRSAGFQPALNDPDAESRLEIGAPDRRRHRETEADRNVHAPQPDPETQFTLRTVGVRQGNAALYAAEKGSPEWSYVGNTAQARLEEKTGLV